MHTKFVILYIPIVASEIVFLIAVAVFNGPVVVDIVDSVMGLVIATDVALLAAFVFMPHSAKVITSFSNCRKYLQAK